MNQLTSQTLFNCDAKIQNAATVLLVTASTVFCSASGCASKTRKPRPSIAQLASESFANSHESRLVAEGQAHDESSGSIEVSASHPPTGVIELPDSYAIQHLAAASPTSPNATNRSTQNSEPLWPSLSVPRITPPVKTTKPIDADDDTTSPSDSSSDAENSTPSALPVQLNGAISPSTRTPYPNQAYPYPGPQFQPPYYASYQGVQPFSGQQNLGAQQMGSQYFPPNYSWNGPGYPPPNPAFLPNEYWPSQFSYNAPAGLNYPGQPSGVPEIALTLGQITILPPLLSGDYVETALRDVLNDLAEDGNTQLVLDDDVTGVVNIRFQDKTVDEAIELVLASQAFYHRRIGNTVYIGPATNASPLFPIISRRIEYRPKHVETKTLVEAVPDSLIQFVNRIEGVESILVEAPDRVLNRIVERFEAIDKPAPQVALEAIVCVVAPDSDHRVGLDWQHAVELDGQQAFRFGVTGLGLGLNVSNGGMNEIFSDFSRTTAFVNALCENGYLAIRASPHVVAQDGEKASITINRETFFSIQPQASGNGDTNAFFFQQNIERVESGITFDITPKVRGDMVTVQIDKAEVSEDIRTDTVEATLNPFPIINRRSVSTTVSVKDGRTIVIGGLMQRETVDRQSAIPVLGHLPVIGGLFRATQRQMRDVEVVIFISPRIIPAEDMVAGVEY